MILAAYKKKFGSTEGAEVVFNDDESEVFIQVKKKIVDDVIDDATEIELEDALEYDSNCEIGDELLTIDGHTISCADDVRTAVKKADIRKSLPS